MKGDWKKAKKEEEEEESVSFESRILSLILCGVNRVFPFAPKDMEVREYDLIFFNFDSFHFSFFFFHFFYFFFSFLCGSLERFEGLFS